MAAPGARSGLAGRRGQRRCELGRIPLSQLRDPHALRLETGPREPDGAPRGRMRLLALALAPEEAHVAHVRSDLDSATEDRPEVAHVDTGQSMGPLRELVSETLEGPRWGGGRCLDAEDEAALCGGSEQSKN